jgi:hypothetical protein
VVDTIAAAFHEQARLRGESGKDIFLGPDYPLQITAYADIARLQVVGAPVSDRSSDLTGQFSLKLRNECLSEISHGANSSNIEKPLNELTHDDPLWLVTSNLDSVLAEEDRENEIAILCDRTRWTALQTYATITLVATLKDGSKISALLK